MAGSYRILISEDALNDLRRIFDFIEVQSPQNAPAVIERLLDEVDGLERMPARFKRVGVRKRSGVPVHSLVVRPFIIYYSVQSSPKIVVIMMVRHGHQRQPTEFD
jgi:plasmid stabilization system protein ParE